MNGGLNIFEYSIREKFTNLLFRIKFTKTSLNTWCMDAMYGQGCMKTKLLTDLITMLALTRFGFICTCNFLMRYPPRQSPSQLYINMIH